MMHAARLFDLSVKAPRPSTRGQAYGVWVIAYLNNVRMRAGPQGQNFSEEALMLLRRMAADNFHSDVLSVVDAPVNASKTA